MSKPKVHPFTRPPREPDPPARAEREDLTVAVTVTAEERVILRMMARRALEQWLKGSK